MLFFDGGFGLIMLGLWIYCIIDVITTPDGAARNLPKMLWLFIVLILPDIGSIVWLVAGHPWNSTTANLPYKGNGGRADARPRTSPARASNPDDDEEFLASVRRRADEQRRRAREVGDDQSPGDAGPR